MRKNLFAIPAAWSQRMDLAADENNKFAAIKAARFRPRD